jgi:hypothetical protein
MAQNVYLFDGYKPKTPAEVTPNWETTYSESSGRVLSGEAVLDPLFTVESYSVSFKHLTLEETSRILNIVVPKPSKPTFEWTYLSAYYGCWRTDTFYVGKGSQKLKTAKESEERFDLSFNVIGVNTL